MLRLIPILVLAACANASAGAFYGAGGGGVSEITPGSAGFSGFAVTDPGAAASWATTGSAAAADDGETILFSSSGFPSDVSIAWPGSDYVTVGIAMTTGSDCRPGFYDSTSGDALVALGAGEAVVSYTLWRTNWISGTTTHRTATWQGQSIRWLRFSKDGSNNLVIETAAAPDAATWLQLDSRGWAIIGSALTHFVIGVGGGQCRLVHYSTTAPS